MKPAAPTKDEAERSAALASLDIVFSPAEDRFDRITEMARKLFDVPIALVSLVADDIQWFKARSGLGADQTPRDVSFCGHAIHRDEAFVVEDAATHPDFSDNPLVTGPPRVRFYAGQPLSYKGRHIGTLCLIDHVPRSLDNAQLESLRQLAAWAENELNAQLPGSAQSATLAAAGEKERAQLLDAEMASWNRRGLEEVLERVLSAPETEMVAAVLQPGGTIPAGVGQELARRIRSVLQPDDVIGHLGAGVFFVLGTQADRPTANLVLRRIQSRLDDPLPGPDASVNPGYIIGAIQGRPAPGAGLDAIIERCEAALKAAAADTRDQRIKVLDWPGVAES